VDLLQIQDVKFEMCGHTLDAYGTSLKDLVGDFTRLNQGGVVRMVELQMQGFAYLRPWRCVYRIHVIILKRIIFIHHGPAFWSSRREFF